MEGFNALVLETERKIALARRKSSFYDMGADVRGEKVKTLKR
jgi:hypothetical protein